MVLRSFNSCLPGAINWMSSSVFKVTPGEMTLVRRRPQVLEYVALPTPERPKVLELLAGATDWRQSGLASATCAIA